MPHKEDHKPNNSNLSFIKEVFGHDAHQNFPEYNYRLRLAGFTEYNPYVSEAPRFDGESQEHYNARVLSSGRYFGEQEIILDNLVWNKENIEGLEIDSQFYDGKIPKTLLFLEECKLEKEEQEDGTFRDMYSVTSKSLNEKNKVKSDKPFITFPVDLPESNAEDDKKGYLVFRKKELVTKVDPDTALGKDNNALLQISSGWEQITGFSSKDIKDLVDGDGDIASRIRAAGFTDNNIESGYESFTNENETRYKVIDSGVYNKAIKDEELTKNRVIDLNLKSQGSAYYSNGREEDGHSNKTYTLERKVTRESNTEDFPAKWEVIEHNATFPYTDEEDLSDFKNVNVNFNVSGVYEVVAPKGANSTEGKDFFEVDLLTDWGKSTDKTLVTNREQTKDLVFRSGESLKVVQKSTRKRTSPNEFDQYNSVDVHFSPYSTGLSGCLTGIGNETGFYELEYQLVPKKESEEKLYYETGENLSVGNRVFLNTGQNTDNTYSPIESDVFGGLPAALASEKNLVNTSDPEDFFKSDVNSYFIDFGNYIRPESVPQNAASGVGYSYFNSGEKYLVVPKGGYNTQGSDVHTTYYSAGETSKVFFQGEQDNLRNDANAHYALTEYRTFDDNPFTEEEFLHKNEREVRVSQKSLCLGDSSTDLQDTYLLSPSYILDPVLRAYPTYNTLTNGSILNIDSDDGTIDIKNLKSDRKEFINGTNLFFEKNYVASLTVLATGQKQDINPLAGFMEKGKKYYIERDIYIDSNVYSQANFSSPTFSSNEETNEISPFAVDVSTPNRLSLGQEKHYLTQVYHTDHDSFPFNDYDFYNSQSQIFEEYFYHNVDSSIISDFSVDNITEARAYYPNAYDGVISASSHVSQRNEGYSVLMNTGAHGSWPGGITVGAYSASDKTADVTFTASNVGAYYEVQHRSSATSDWKTVSPAILATSESSSIKETVGKQVNKIDNNDDGAANFRILEWIPSAIMSNYEGVSVPSESPDSLILQGATSGPRIYDISKQEHSITNSSVTVPSTNTFAFNGSASLTIPSHRSFDIQNGEFSFEFYLGHSSADIGDGTILEREGAVKIYIDSNHLKVDFNGENVINYNVSSLDFQQNKHIAICKHVVNKLGNETSSNLSLFIDGKREFKLETSYSEYSFKSTKNLVIGSGLTAKILHFRFYSGKSIYRDVDSFTRPTITNGLLPFTSESQPRKYKILKLNYKLEKSKQSNWIINKNIFDNVNPPWDYQLEEEQEDLDETTKHGYEWLSQTSARQENEKNRAIINYLERYAYRAPNNPHINKNYDGTPIEIKDNEALDLNALVSPETYHYRVYRGSASKVMVESPAPYYYEYKGSSDIFNLRNKKKGGENNKEIPDYSQEKNSFSNGSRLRVTKYVYRLYTKDAVVVGDGGHKNSRSSQQGWDYQLQYSTNSGSDWKDADSIESYEDYIVFMNEDGSYSPTSFENIDHSFILPTLIKKTNITEKYEPSEIIFRIEKRQNLSISNQGTEVEVFKKFNPLPFEVNIPLTGAIFDLTKKTSVDSESKQEAFSSFDSSSKVLTVNLESGQDYVVQKGGSDETIYLDSALKDELKVRSINRNNYILNERLLSDSATDERQRFKDEESYSSLENGKPYVINGVEKLFVKKETASSNTDFDTVVGIEPSGIDLYRVEKSYKTKSFDNSVRSVNPVSGIGITQTKFFFTPDITGSHFDELEGMPSSLEVVPDENSLISFSGETFITGSNGDTVSSGISGITFEPLHKFRNTVMTGKFYVDANDHGKTFLCSGNQASGVISHEGKYDFDAINVSSDNIKFYKVDGSQSTVVKTLSDKNTATFTYNGELSIQNGSDVVIPDPSIISSDEDITQRDLFLIDNISGVDLTASNLNNHDPDDPDDKKSLLVNISKSDCYVNGPNVTVGSMSGVLFNNDASLNNTTNSGVVVVDHNQIVLTSDDAGLTGVINTDSTLVLPSGFSDGQSVTFLNSTNFEAKVISESGYAINNKLVHYIPKSEAIKFNYNKNDANWSASNIEVIKYNQLDVPSSTADNEVFVHDEDVDVRIQQGFSGKSFNVVRSQIYDIDLSDLRSQKTPILRVFYNDKLKYTAKPGVLGVKVTESGGKFTFKDIDVISNDVLSIDKQSHGKVFCYSGSSGELSLNFLDSDYKDNFELFLITNKTNFDFSLYFESQGDIYKFNDNEESGFFSYEVSGMSRDVMVRISNTRKDSGKPVAINRFFVETVGQKGLEERSSNIYKTTQANDQEEIIINRKNRDLGLELPKLDSSYEFNKKYNLLYVNASETSSQITYPREALGEEGEIDDLTLDSQSSFSSKLYNYKKQEDSSNSYQNFQQTEIYKSHNKAIKNDDVAIINDSTLNNIHFKTFLNENFLVTNKFPEDTENLVRQISCDEDNTLTLPNHGLVTNQRLNFLCDRLTNVDYYWNGDLDTLDDVNTIDGTALLEGDTVLLKEDGSYFLYVYEGSSEYKQITLSVPESEEGLFEDLSEGYTVSDVGKIFFRVNKDSDVTNVESGHIFDFANNAITDGVNLSADTDGSIASIFSMSIDQDSDSGLNKTQTYFVEVLDQNRFKLYRNRNSTNILNIESTNFDANKYFLSDLFYASDIECSRADVINIGDGEKNLKTFQDDIFISGNGSTLENGKVVDLFSHSDGTYTSGDINQSGVHFVTGYNGSQDTLNISSLNQSRHLVSSGVFHTSTDSLVDFDGDFFINSELESVEINGTTELSKNRAYKYSSSTFEDQDPSLSTSEILYYPKNEIHIPNRKSLTKNQNSRKFDYNFVFVKPEVHNPDLFIILPHNSWSNKLNKVAVVNLHNRPINVANFDRSASTSVNANSVLFIEGETLASTNSESIDKNYKTSSGYSFSSEDDFIDDASVSHAGKEETYYISHTGDIILDYTTHNNKKIFIESNVRFTSPYLHSPDGSTDYVSNGYYEPAGSSDHLEFQLINISTEKKQYNEGSDGEIQSKVVYDVSIENFEVSEDLEIRYFKINSDNQTVANKTNYSQTYLDSNFDYHIFGKQLELDLSVYYREINVDEARRANYLFDSDLDTENFYYYRIIGIGGENNSTLTIANNIYENIKINSINLVGSGLTEDGEELIKNKILNYFADETASDSFVEEVLDDGQTTTEIPRAITENYLRKNKAIKISVEDIIGEYSLRIFDEDGLVVEEEEELEYINLDRTPDVVYLKKDEVYFDIEQSSEESTPYFRYVITSPADVFLPSRRELCQYSTDVFLLVVNASMQTCRVKCPNGSSWNSSNSYKDVAAGSAIKIKWTADANLGSFSEQVGDLKTTVLNKTLFSCEYGAFLASQANTQSSPLLISSSIQKIKIINNTGSAFYVDHEDSSGEINGSTAAFSISSFCSTDLINHSNNFKIDKQLQNIEFKRLRDSVTLSKGIYENQVVLFDAESIKSFSMSDKDYFSVNFVPLIRTKEFGASLSDTLNRAKIYYNEYSVTNNSSQSVFIYEASPLKFYKSGNDWIKSTYVKKCSIREFVLNSGVNDKIVFTSKIYDYVFENSQNIALSLFSNVDDSIEMHRLDAAGDKFTPQQNLLEGTEFDLSSRSIFSIGQSGATVAFSHQQTYTDYIVEDEDTAEKYLVKSFYADKNAYYDKIIVFNKPFFVSYQGAPELLLVNNSANNCLIDNGSYLKDGVEESTTLKPLKIYEYNESYNDQVLKPKYLLSQTEKVNVLNSNAEASFSSAINEQGTKVINASNRSLLCDGNIIYSFESAKFNSATSIDYSICPNFNRKDWFLTLENIDIPHLEQDLDYYNEKEAQAERLTQTKGANVEYKSTKYRFSSIFNTNLFEPQKYRSGYESISKFNSRYTYGVTLYGNKKGEKEKIEYDTDFTNYALNGLKLSWDMPEKVIAYSLNTGHERLNYCKHFDERNGLVTLSGIEKDRTYIVEDFDETHYNVVYSSLRVDEQSVYPYYKYKKDTDSEEFEAIKFQPRIKYNGKFYKAGSKFKGIEGLTDYQVHYIYFTELKANQFISSTEEERTLLNDQKIGLNQYNEEIEEKVKDSTKGVISPIWTVVPEGGVNESNFKIAKVEEITTNGSDKELIKGKKLKDIQGSYTTGDDGGGFEFKIPYDSAYSNITKDFVNGEIKFLNETSEAYKEDGYYKFKVTFNENRLSPGYEYEIKSSFKVANDSGKDLLTLSIKSEDSMPFAADDSIKSLNLDFNTDSGQEVAMLDGGTYDSAFSKRVALAEGSGRRTLKSSTGHSLIPFNRYGQNFYGLSFISTVDKKTYSGIRFRLKKLIDKKLRFEDLKEGNSDEKSGIGTYLSKGSGLLQYNLETEVESFSFHDVAKPGGVLRMSYPDWEDVEIKNNNLKVTKQLSNGDAVVFQNSSGSIKRGQPYFIRFVSGWTTGSEPVAEAEVLRIFSLNTDIDTYNKIAYNEGVQNNKYKIVNYFDLGFVDEKSHRSEDNLKRNIIKNTYFADPASSPVTSLNYPIVLGGINMYLEAPLTEFDGDVIDKWGNYDGMSGSRLRFNLELSEIAKHWHGEDNDGLSFASQVGIDEKYINNTDSHWANEDVFSSYKNLLYRDNTQIDFIEINEVNEDTIAKIIIKLNTNTNYRYIYKGGEYIKKVTLNSVELSKSGGTVYNTNEDLVIELYVDSNEDTDFYQTPRGDENRDIIKNIYENLCIVELSTYIDTHKDNSDPNINEVDYLDYMIPSLNSNESFGGEESVFTNVYPSYFTEGNQGILSYGEKADNLVDYEGNGFTADLFYDLGMPAICEYVYLDFVNKNKLSFSITNFWDGFEHKFEGASQYYKVKPTEFNYTLQQSSDGQSWSDLETGKKGEEDNDENFAIGTTPDLNSSNKFRMKINSVTVQYKNPDESSNIIYKFAILNKFRLPFKWTSIIKDSDLGSSSLDTGSELYMHQISMPNNFVIGKSVGFPKDGFTRLGEFNYVSEGVPYVRYYMFNLSHSLIASYKDPIKRAGVSKVIITNRGENYRTEPTISLPSPTKTDGIQATASAIIESGKLKHIEITNSGSGYSDLSSEIKARRKRIETSRASSIPLIYHTIKIQNDTERRLDFSNPIDALKAQTGLEILDVTITGNESSLPQEIQEEFGLTSKQIDKIEEYLETSDQGANLSKSRDYPKVDLIKGTPEDEDWALIQDIADSMQKRANVSAEILSDIEDSDAYGTEFYEEDSLGTESEFIDGVYEEDSSDENLTGNVSSKIQFDSDGNSIVYETFPSVSSASAIAIVNNTSVADYRVIDNEQAAKATPWLSSFNRSDNPALPKSFGIIPGSEISSEVFNTYARAINYLTKIRVEAPIYAKIRRYKQIEWRYISNPNMAGLTFVDSDDAGEAKFEYGDLNTSFDYYTHEAAFSKVNYIAYLDPVDNKLRVAHFSGYTGDGSASNKDNIHELEGDESSKIWDIFESKIKEGNKFKVKKNNTKTPSDIGLPNIVNIPTEMGVYCNPSIAYDKSRFLVTKGEGVPLPTPVNKRAFAYGGDLVYTSPIYDVSSDTYPLIEDSKSEIGELGYDEFGAVEGSSLVNIRGTEDFIKAGYQNQIVFGCQTNGKPFWSAFLRTTKVWTEYEVVSSPEFTESLPEGIRDKYRPQESKLRCQLISKRVSCSNDVIGKVEKSTGYHSICSEGTKTFNLQHSYEDTFNLSEGDSVIGPKSSVNETTAFVQAAGKGEIKVEPEFDLSLAVYSANETIKAIRAGAHHPNDYIGPCIHYCMPGQIKSLKVSEDPLIFDLSK